MLDKPSDNAEPFPTHCAAFLTVLAAETNLTLRRRTSLPRNLKSGNISSPSGTFSPLFSA